MKELKLHERYKIWSKISAISVVGLGLLVLTGWQFDIQFFKSIFPGLVAMNPVTAVCFIFAGTSLLLSTNNNSKSKHLLAKLLASMLFLLGIIKIGGLITGLDLHPDNILFAEKINSPYAENAYNRMAPNTAFNFILCGAALISINYETARKQMPAQYVALLVGLIGLLSILGYMYQVKPFYGVLTYIPMALHTAFGFIFLSLAILYANPGKGIMEIITGSYTGSSTIRFLIPAAIIIPAILGYLRLLGQSYNLFTIEFGTALLILSIIIIFICLIWYNGASLNKRESQQKQHEDNALLAAIVNSSDDAIISKSLDGFIQSWNKGAEKIFGYSTEEMMGRHISKLVPAPFIHEEKNIVKKINEGESVEHYETVRSKKNGESVHVSLTVSPIKDGGGNIIGVSKIVRDITERKKAEGSLKDRASYIEKRSTELMDALLKYTTMDFSQRLEVSEKGDEWDAIAVGLNTLCEELTSHIVQIKHTNEELEISNKELESFSYSVSHDLRAPLRAIHSYTKILEEDYKGKILNEDALNTIQVILRNSKKMGELIDDLLAFSRLGKKEISYTDINMNSLAKIVAHEFLLSDIQQKIDLNIQTLLPASGDSSMIKQVWVNLISNAIKYSCKTEKAVISVGCMEKGSKNIYYIKDNGVGFNMKYYSKLFGVFQRLHSQEEFEGTGVGLAIVQRIISRHGGEVWGESKLNEGATFYFSLPKINS